MKAIVCPRWGEPDQVLEVREVPTPVRVRMLASPINPSDLFMVRGQYGYQPTKRTYEMICLFFQGLASEQELEDHIARLHQDINRKPE